jgi:hypothetical protein
LPLVRSTLLSFLPVSSLLMCTDFISIWMEASETCLSSFSLSRRKLMERPR